MTTLPDKICFWQLVSAMDSDREKKGLKRVFSEESICTYCRITREEDCPVKCYEPCRTERVVILEGQQGLYSGVGSLEEDSR